MEGFDPEKYDEILGIGNDGYKTYAVVTLGYRSPDDPYAKVAKVRYPKDEVVKYI
jgi:nitroreductase